MKIGADQQQPWRHDADNRARAATDSNRAIKNAGIAAESRLPQAMTDDRRRRTVRTELVAGEAAPQYRRHSENRKEVIEKKRREHAFRDVAAREIAIAEVEGSGVREASARTDVEILRRRQRLDEGPWYRDSPFAVAINSDISAA